jgi:hypothetical protein
MAVSGIVTRLTSTNRYYRTVSSLATLTVRFEPVRVHRCFDGSPARNAVCRQFPQGPHRLHHAPLSLRPGGPDGRLDDVVAQRITVGLEHSGVAPPRTQPVAERSIASENPVGHFGHRLLQLIVTTDPSKKTIRKGLPYLTPRGGSLRRRSYLAQGLATLCS